MKANELRIGNYVLDSYNGKITRINWQEIKWIQEVTDRYASIELTEEILLKCGFDKSAWDNYSTFRNLFCSDGCIVISLEHKYIEIGDLTLDIEIKYLHQLQNLYFALTNKEIQFDL